MAHLRTVFLTAEIAQAHRFRKRLAEYGITAEILSEDDPRVRSNLESALHVAVDEGDYEFAYEIAADFDDSADPAHESVDTGWPCCPRCSARRTAVCPSCRNPSSSLRIVDWVESTGTEPGGFEWRDADGDQLMLCCSLCDHPFTAQFERRCRRCGHSFADGVRPRRVRSIEELFSAQNIFVVFMIITLVVMLWVYLLRAGPQ